MIDAIWLEYRYMTCGYPRSWSHRATCLLVSSLLDTVVARVEMPMSFVRPCHAAGNAHSHLPVKLAGPWRTLSNIPYTSR